MSVDRNGDFKDVVNHYIANNIPASWESLAKKVAAAPNTCGNTNGDGGCAVAGVQAGGATRTGVSNAAAGCTSLDPGSAEQAVGRG
jgi:hypothetical protein